MPTIDANSLLLQMRTMAAKAQGADTALPAVGGAAPVQDFGTLLKGMVNDVNAAQQRSNELRKDFEIGKPGVDLTRVLVEGEKADLSFQVLTQVRNRLVNAYRDVMNMPI
jgi:flagellar hook-basal body complex protein FliE